MNLKYQYIRSVELKKNHSIDEDKYPYNIEAVKRMDRLKIHPKVTFIVGENGSGKSTLLEALAVAYGFNPEGGTKNFNFSSLDTHSQLYKDIKIIKGIQRPKDGFFLRAESYYNVASQVELLEEIVPGMYESYGGKSLHDMSHGESFFATMMNRFSKDSLFILDEPEAALSPQRQLTMISRIHELVGMNCQFIIATHSPILMAYPNAYINTLDGDIRVIDYMDTDHYQVTKCFLDNPDRMLNILLD